MTSSKITKKMMGEALKSLAQDKNFLKISIKDICRECHMNRGSFYYHFRDKNELVDWVFIDEFYEPMFRESDNYDRNEFLRKLMKYFDDNRAYYKNVFQYDGQNCFANSLHDIIRPLIEKEVALVLEAGKKRNFCVDFFCDMIISILKTWFNSKEEMTPEEVFEFGNYALVDIAKTIEYY